MRKRKRTRKHKTSRGARSGSIKNLAASTSLFWSFKFITISCQVTTVTWFQSMFPCLWIQHKKIQAKTLNIRVGVEDTRLEAKAKDTKKFRGQGQGQTLSRPRIKDTGAGVLQKKEGLQNFFSSDLKKKVFKNFFQAKKVFKNFFQAISTWEKQKRSSQIFCEVSGAFQQNYNGSKNSAVLKPRTGQFSRSWGFKAKDFKMCPRVQGRPRGLHLC